uniref:Mediator of RNA polymerase II transcription subunit 18 n=1 Tax=Meleagris gallopavo TaxID=9103 RepID=A0A803YS98_MELGA
MEPETFLDHEMVFLLKGQQASPFVLRARRSMDKSGMPWHLRYLGQPEIGDKNRHALVRNCVDIATSDNLTDFLVEMGFRMDHEFVAKGHVFRKGIMKIVVYKIFRILMPGNTDSIEPLSLSYLVELNVVAPAGQDIVSDDMRNFAEQLKPLVHLEKIDPKRNSTSDKNRIWICILQGNTWQAQVCLLQKSLREESKKKQVTEIPSKMIVAVIPPVSLETEKHERATSDKLVKAELKSGAKTIRWKKYPVKKLETHIGLEHLWAIPTMPV